MSEPAVLEKSEAAAAALLVMPTKAGAAFADYVKLGPQRSLRKLLARYVEDGVKSPASIRQLERWSLDYAWQDRLKALAAEQIERASEYRAGTYVAITQEYYQRVVEDEPMRHVMKLESLNSIYDRVKPEQPAASSGGGSSANLTIQFIFQEVVRP